MKSSALAILAFATVSFAGCASTPKTDTTQVRSATLDPASQEGASDSADGVDRRSGADRWAEAKAKKEAEAEKTAAAKTPSNALDPLEMGGALEDASVPNVTLTPSAKVRAKTLGDLNAALSMMRATATLEAGVKTLTARLGPPTWVESPKGADSAKRRVWVAQAGARCHRLVLEPDGAIEIDSAAKTELRMLSASARQSPCTGEITRGLSSP